MLIRLRIFSGVSRDRTEGPPVVRMSAEECGIVPLLPRECFILQNIAPSRRRQHTGVLSLSCHKESTKERASLTNFRRTSAFTTQARIETRPVAKDATWLRQRFVLFCFV